MTRTEKSTSAPFNPIWHTTGPNLRILVVDDCEDQTTSTASLLHQHGYEADIALDGPVALEKMRDFAPDVVLLDLGLPGMSGYEVAARLMEQGDQKPPVIIAVTGWTGDEARKRSLDSGIHLHLDKPVEPHTLLAALDRIRRAVGYH